MPSKERRTSTYVEGNRLQENREVLLELHRALQTKLCTANSGRAPDLAPKDKMIDPELERLAKSPIRLKVSSLESNEASLTYNATKAAG